MNKKLCYPVQMLYCPLKMFCCLMVAILSFIATCQGNQCSDLASPLSGSVRITNNNTATYRCDECWTISGNTIRNCTSEGKWTGDVPLCGMYCKDPALSHGGGRNTDAVGVLGSSIVFFCRVSRINTSQIIWYFNDSYVNDSHIYFDNTIVMKLEQINVLVLHNISSNFNNSRIKCSVVYFEEYVYNSSESLFLIQGHLFSATNLSAKLQFDCTNNGSIYIRWEPPHTLDIPQVKNDIIYTVMLAYLGINIKLNDIVTTQIEIPIANINPRNISCEKFVVTIISNNEVGSGESSTLTTFKIQQDTQILVVNQVGMIIEDGHYEYNLTTTPAICDINITSSVNITSTVIEGQCGNESLIHLDLRSEELLKHIYTITSLIGETGVPFIFKISTFDIQKYNFSLSSPHLETTVQIEYLKNSLARGAMLIFLDNDLNINNFQIIRRGRNHTYNLASYSSNRISFIYDIDSNGYVDSGNISPAFMFSETPDIIFEELNYDNCSINCTENTLRINCICPYKEMYQVILKDVLDSSGSITAGNVTSCSTYSQFEVNEKNFSVLAFQTSSNHGNLEYEVLYFMPEYGCFKKHNYGRKNCEYSFGLICSGVMFSIIAILHLKKSEEEMIWKEIQLRSKTTTIIM